MSSGKCRPLCPGIDVPSFLYINSSPPSAAYMRQWTVWALVQVMAWRLFGAMPLPEPMLGYYQLDSWEQVSVKFESEFYHSHSRKCICNCRLPKWRPFCPRRDEITIPRGYGVLRERIDVGVLDVMSMECWGQGFKAGIIPATKLYNDVDTDDIKEIICPFFMSIFYIAVRSHGCHWMSNHRRPDRLLNNLITMTRKKHRYTLLALCVGNPSITTGSPSRRISNKESAPLPRRHVFKSE